MTDEPNTVPRRPPLHSDDYVRAVSVALIVYAVWLAVAADLSPFGASYTHLWGDIARLLPIPLIAYASWFLMWSFARSRVKRTQARVPARP